MPKSATRREIDERLERIGRPQQRLLKIEQLTATGLSPRAVSARAAAGRLHRIHHGVYSLTAPPHSRRQLYLAAIYACGPGSVISDRPAAAILGLVETAPLTAHVSNRTGAGRSRAGIVVHRRLIDPRDVAGKGGIPCTSAARTIIDCAHSAGAEGTEELIMAADSLQILNRRRLEELVAEHHGRPGVGHITALISDDPTETRSRNERRMLSICREFGVARPRTNHRIEAAGRTFYADFCWPELGLIVEADSWRWHGGRRASESDVDRDQLLALAGWRVVHFTRDQIKGRRAETGRRLVALTSGT